MEEAKRGGQEVARRGRTGQVLHDHADIRRGEDSPHPIGVNVCAPVKTSIGPFWSLGFCTYCHHRRGRPARHRHTIFTQYIWLLLQRGSTKFV
ncbi:unnamed protein product [Ixodes pacificus]